MANRDHSTSKAHEVLAHLRSNGQLSDDALQSLSEDVTVSGGPQLVRQLVNNGLSSREIAKALSQVLNRPMLGSDVGISHSGEDYAIDAHGLCFVVNPLDPDRRQELLQAHGAAIRDFGILAFDQLDFVGDSAADEDVAETHQLDDPSGEFRRILERAISARASDIHLQPVNDLVDVRIRVDGMLRRITTYRMDDRFIALANVILDTCGFTPGEFNKPLDGQFPYTMQHRAINVRMSMIPVRVGSNNWPRFSMRLLGLELNLIDVDHLGLPNTPDNTQLQNLKDAISAPFGLVLVSGPTGSGKTTTLSAGMRWLTRINPRQSYFSAEDPVEVEIPSVSQVEMNPRADITFASATRAFLRQDPDAIMIGEIRDYETMEAAIRAGLTGHLIMATIHANHAFGVIPRLLNMGGEPDLIADVLTGLMAQRTVRKVCPDCSAVISFRDYLALGHPFHKALTQDEREAITRIPQRYGDMGLLPAPDEGVRIANSLGCNSCSRGFNGRVVVTEFSPVDATIKRMIAARQPEVAIREYARTIGFRELWEHGLAHFRDGVSVFTEIERRLGKRSLASTSTPAVQETRHVASATG